MERTGLAAAIGCVSAIVAALSLLGLIEASLIGVALALVALRASASAIESSGHELSKTSIAAIPLVALVVVGILRAGDASLDAVRGANAVLGPAVITRPGILAAATLLACLSALATGPRIEFERSLASGLKVTAWVLTGLLVVTVAVGPTIEGIESLVSWTSAGVVVFAAMAYTRGLTDRPRASLSAALVSGVSVALVAFL